MRILVSGAQDAPLGAWLPVTAGDRNALSQRARDSTSGDPLADALWQGNGTTPIDAAGFHIDCGNPTPGVMITVTQEARGAAIVLQSTPSATTNPHRLPTGHDTVTVRYILIRPQAANVVKVMFVEGSGRIPDSR